MMVVILSSCKCYGIVVKASVTSKFVNDTLFVTIDTITFLNYLPMKRHESLFGKGT